MIFVFITGLRREKKSNPEEEKAEIDNFKGRSEQYKNLQDRYTVYSLFITTRFDILPNYCSSHVIVTEKSFEGTAAV